MNITAKLSVDQYSLKDFCPFLQDWVECKDFMLGLSGIHRGQLPVDTSSIRHCKVSVENVFQTDNYTSEKIDVQLNASCKHWGDAINSAMPMREELQKQLCDDNVALQIAELSQKREILRYMKVISSPIAAAYLGMSEDSLNRLKNEEKNVFGGDYAGGYCYSMEELNLIARNHGWTNAWSRADYDHDVPHVEVTSLDQVVMVDVCVAVAFTNMSPTELSESVPHTSHSYRPYRLADLEKIRMAKLAASLT
jgi:hypothetical protein